MTKAEKGILDNALHNLAVSHNRLTQIWNGRKVPQSWQESTELKKVKTNAIVVSSMVCGERGEQS